MVEQQGVEEGSAVVEDVHASAFEVEPVTASPGLEREFQDYATATEFLNELEHPQAELSSQQSVMDSLWVPSASPQPALQQEEDEEEAVKQQVSCRCVLVMAV